METYPGADTDRDGTGAELSEEDLELVVGGLERVRMPPAPPAYAAPTAPAASLRGSPRTLGLPEVPIGHVAWQY